MEPVLHKQLETRLRWNDEFDGDLSKWLQPNFETDGRHRTGNKYIQLDGTVDLSKPWHKVPGRWAALYNDHREKCQFIRDGVLVMKGHAVNEPNPYRENFTDSSGVVHPYGDWKLYAPWLQCKEHFSRGSVLEVRVNVENQLMRSHRWNFWGMPIDGNAYDADGSSVEIDAPELENPSRAVDSSFGYKALLKVVGGDAGDSEKGEFDLRKFGIDIRKGWHTFTTVWNHDGSLEFLVDGILVNTDPRHVTMVAEIIMAREMNSGVKKLPEDGILHSWENYSTNPKIPADDGLTGNSVILDLDLIDKDEVLIDYVRVYDIIDEETQPKIDEPDVDLGDLSLDEQISMLIWKYDEAAEQLYAKDGQIEELEGRLVDLNEEIEQLKKKETPQLVSEETLALLLETLRKAA